MRMNAKLELLFLDIVNKVIPAISQPLNRRAKWWGGGGGVEICMIPGRCKLPLRCLRNNLISLVSCSSQLDELTNVSAARR